MDANSRLQLGMNPTSFPQIGRDIVSGRDSGRSIGAGATPGDCATVLLDQIRCNLADSPKVPFKRTYFNGPVADAVLTTSFGPQIDMLSSTSPGAKETSGNYLNNGALPFSMLITGIYCHLVPNPYSMTVEGGSFTSPTAAQGANKGIVVPDQWLGQDATAAAGSLNIPTGSSLNKAYLDVGGWIQRAFYWLARGWNWYWLNGDNIIMNYPLREVAHVVPVPQDYTNGQARMPFAQSVADANAYYRSPNGTGAQASTTIFLPRNATRTGVLHNGGTPVSTFEPYSYFDEAVTYGGPGVAEMGCNPEYYRLPKCIVWPANTPLGMTLQQVSAQAATRAQRELSITNNVGGAPPGIIYPDTDYSSTTTTGAAFATTLNTGGTIQVSQDNPPVNDGLVMQGPGMAIFKIGDFWMVFGLIGWGLTDGIYNMLVDPANSSQICSIVASATGGKVCLSMPGARG